MTLNDDYVDGVARRKQCVVLCDLAGPQNVGFLDSENVVNDLQNHRNAGPIASRLLIAVYRCRISRSASASVTSRCPAAIRRSRRTCASVLCGCAAPMRYIGMLESTKIKLDSPARSRGASDRYQRSGMSIPRHIEPPSTSFPGRSPAFAHGLREESGEPTLQTVSRSRRARRWMSDISWSGSRT